MKKKRLTYKKLLIITAVLLSLVCVFLFQIEAYATLSLNRLAVLRRLDYIHSSVEEYSDMANVIQDKTNFYKKSVVNFLAYLEDHYENFDPQTTPKLIYPEDEILVNQNIEEDKDYSVSKSSSGNEYAVINDNGEEWKEIEDGADQMYNSIEEIIKQNDLFLLVNSKGIVTFSNNDDYRYKTIDQLGLDLNDVPVDEAGWVEIDGKSYYTASRINKGDGDRYILALKSQTINTNNRIAAYFIIVAIWIITILTISYYYFLRQENKDGYDGDELLKKTYSHPWVLCALGAIAIGIVTLHIQSLFGLSVYSIQKSNAAEHIQSKSDLMVEDMKLRYRAFFITDTKKTDALARAMSLFPELKNSKSLQEMRDLFDMEFFEVYNIDGNRLESSSALYQDMYSDWQDEPIFFDNVNYFIPKQSLQKLETEKTLQYKTPIIENGTASFYLQGGIPIQNFIKLADQMELNTFMKNIPIEKGNEIIVVDSESTNVLYSTQPDYTGTSILNLKIPETALDDDSFVSVNMEGDNYYSTTTTMDKYSVLLLSPKGDVFDGRFEITLMMTGLCALVLGGLIFLISRRELDPLPVITEEDDQNDDQSRLGWIERIRKHKVWHQTDAEDRVMAIARFVYRILSLLVLGIVLFRGALYRDSTIFGFLVNGRWEKGFNIFAITSVVIIWLVYSVFMQIFLYLFKKLLSMVKPKSETILRLMRSFIVYGTMLAMIFYSMNVLGFDSASLLASAGLVGLIISWGAKDMITDILAGLFIIFENQFQVGDIIEVNGEKGTVLEIGVRTTRLMTVPSDTRIISNRSLTNVLNKSRNPSNGSIVIHISYKQDLNAVENMLREELPKLQYMDPAILSGPIYLGVIDFGERTIQLLVGFKSEEKNRFRISTHLSSEISRLFKEHDMDLGINPQDIEISYDEESSD